MTSIDLSGVNPVGRPSSMDVFDTASKAISFTEQLPSLTQKLREALTGKFSESPLFGQRETAMQGFLNAPSQSRADISQRQKETGVPLAPTQQQAITSARRSAAYAPLDTSSLLLSSAFGGLEDIIGQGVQAFQAASEAQTQKANLMQQLYQTELDRMFKEKGLELDWAKFNKPSGSGSASSTASKEAKLTMDYIADIQSYTTREEAMRDFELMQGLMASQGVDTDAVRNAIDTYFPPEPQISSFDYASPKATSNATAGGNWLSNLISSSKRLIFGR